MGLTLTNELLTTNYSYLILVTNHGETALRHVLDVCNTNMPNVKERTSN